MLLRNREKGGTGKLRSFWETTVYRVVKKDPEIPVYTIEPETGKKVRKRVHRNNIFKCNAILPQEVEKIPKSQVKLQKTKNMGKRGDDKGQEWVRSESETDSDDSESLAIIRTTRHEAEAENFTNEQDSLEDEEEADADEDNVGAEAEPEAK